MTSEELARSSALQQFLCSNPAGFARALASQAEEGLIDPESDISIAIRLECEPLGVPAADMSARAARTLWQLCPSIAALFELTGDLDEERNARLREFVGWNPSANGSLPIGRPPDQAILGRSLDLLEHLRKNMGLVPKVVLDLDNYALANFEWLGDPAARAAAETWMRRNSLAGRHAEQLPHEARRFFDALAKPAGAEPLADFSQRVLAVALRYVLSTGGSAGSGEALRAAAMFARRLAVHDFVLAHVLAARERLHTHVDA